MLAILKFENWKNYFFDKLQKVVKKILLKIFPRNMKIKIFFQSLSQFITF